MLYNSIMLLYAYLYVAYNGAYSRTFYFSEVISRMYVILTNARDYSVEKMREDAPVSAM